MTPATTITGNRTDEEMLIDFHDWDSPAMEGVTWDTLKEHGYMRINAARPAHRPTARLRAALRVARFEPGAAKREPPRHVRRLQPRQLDTQSGKYYSI
jgi:hypothetical protein